MFIFAGTEPGASGTEVPDGPAAVAAAEAAAELAQLRQQLQAVQADASHWREQHAKLQQFCVDNALQQAG